MACTLTIICPSPEATVVAETTSTSICGLAHVSGGLHRRHSKAF